MFERTANFLRLASYGELQLSGDATPWLTVWTEPPECGDGDPANLLPAVNSEAEARGYILADYDRLIYVIPPGNACFPGDGGGLGYARGRTVFVVPPLDGQLVSHELGHTLGLGHAQARVCVYAPGRVCIRDEYGDPVDAMADGTGDFNPLEKYVAGWLPKPRSISRTGVYTLDQFEVASTFPQALILRTRRGEFWLAHREPLANDSRLRLSQSLPGLEIRLRLATVEYDPPLTPALLVTNSFANGGAVPVGKTFTEPGLFAVRVMRHEGTRLVIRVRFLRPSSQRFSVTG